MNSPSDVETSPPKGRHQRRAAVFVMALVVLIVAGLIASRFIKSPAETAAETAPPRPNVLTAVVQHRVLNSTLIERGTVNGDHALSVTPPLEPSQAQEQYVTQIAVGVGKEVKAGRLVLAVSGRPLIALQGVIPAYRDLAIGSTGTDVLQLQRALSVVGGVGNDARSTYGRGTAAAVGRLYRRAGYRPIVVRGEPSLPLAEVAFIPSFPATVTQLSAAVGDPVKAPLVSFDTGTLHVNVDLDPNDAGLVTGGMRVGLVAEAIDQQARGRVSDVGSVTTAQASGSSTSGSDDGDLSGPFVPVVVSPSQSLSRAWLGQDVRVTFTAAQTSGPVLVVPAAALTTASDGTTSVTVETGKASRVIAVRAGASGDGYVEVTAPSGTLVAGDRVVVGE